MSYGGFGQGSGPSQSEYVGSVLTADTDPIKLTEMMVGRAVSLNIERSETA